MNKAKKSKPTTNRATKRAAEEIVVDIHIHPLVISQARAFANGCRSISDGIQENGTSAELLAYMVNAGLSIELYLKGLMIVARSGRVTKGHDLDALYKEFPDFLRDFLEFTYKAKCPADGWKLTMHALKFSASEPKVPDVHPAPKFHTFADALHTIKDAFVRARYFFEQVDNVGWSVFAYAPMPLDAAMLALDAAYEHLLAGSLKQGKT
jgi:HEPN domain-containing protein